MTELNSLALPYLKEKYKLTPSRFKLSPFTNKDKLKCLVNSPTQPWFVSTVTFGLVEINPYFTENDLALHAVCTLCC